VSRKALFTGIALCLILIITGHSSGEYIIKEYDFVWHVVTVGGIDIKIQKNPTRFGVLLSSRGGKIATLFLEPIQAIAIGEALLKAEDYHQQVITSYNQQVKGFEKDIIKTVPAGGHKVIFSLTQKGGTFEIKIMAPKMFSPAVLVEPENAEKVGNYLIEAEIMTKQVEKHVRL
jgi:hypothetical protein